MLVSELVQNVRDQLLERNVDPINDSLILRRLNDAYRFVYNKYAKSNDNMFGRDYFIRVNTNQQDYDIPKSIWNKRIETFEVPNIPTQSSTPSTAFSYIKVKKVDRRQLHQYDTPAYRSIIPSAWCQYGNRIRLSPAPSVSYLARLFAMPQLVNLGLIQGRIVDFVGNRVYLDDAVGADIIAALGGTDKAYLSISDFQNGNVKGVFAFNDASGDVITLAPSTRGQYLGTTVISVLMSQMFEVSLSGSTLTATIGEHDFSVGDYIELEQTVDTTVNYRVQDTNITSELYHPAEVYSIPSEMFSRGGRVTSITDTTVSWIDVDFVPMYTDGYVTGQTPAATIPSIISATGTTTSDFFTATFATNIAGTIANGGAWNVKVGDVIRVQMSGSGATPTSLNTATYAPAIVTAANVIQIGLRPTFVGNSGFSGTVDLSPLSSGITGMPALLSEDTGTTPVAVGVVYANTPYALSTIPSNKADPFGYDDTNDIVLDDLVTLGVTTGCSVLSEAFSEFLWKHAVLTIRGSLNENDPEINKQMRELQADITGDTAGRPLGREIERTFGLKNNYRRPLRR